MFVSPHRFALFASTACLTLTLAVAKTVDAEPVVMNGQRELFVDPHLVERLTGAELRMHHPHRAGVAIEFDAPWEGAFCGYATVIKDGPLYRMYYRGLPQSGSDGSRREVTCYAESTDGITWTKPTLELFEVRGTRENNVVLADAAPVTHNFCPFLDDRPGCEEDQRYKALGGTARSGLIAYVSADGLRWNKLQEEPVFNDEGWVFDSQNVPFWSQAEQSYVLYYRRSVDGVRAIARATSSDFRHWSEPVQMSLGQAPAEHLYTNQTRPYYRAPHIYVGVAARFMPGRQVLTPEQAESIGVDPKYFGDISDAVLLTTRGGDQYDRTFLSSFIRPGLGIENWVSRTNYPALGIVPTGEAEMSVYVQKNYGQPTARLDRYTMRPDGFVSVHAPYAGGELLTRPLVIGADAGETPRLYLNFSTSAAGYIKVEVQDVDGNVLPGFSLEDSAEIIGDQLDRAVDWKSGADLSKLKGQKIRLRLAIKDADLFAIQVR